MIQLTRLNDSQFLLNAERIRFIEKTPDTIVTLDTGKKQLVRESVDQVLTRMIQWRRLYGRNPLLSGGGGDAATDRNL